MAKYTWKSSNNGVSLVKLTEEKDKELIDQGYEFKKRIPAGTRINGYYEKINDDYTVNFSLPVGLNVNKFNNIAISSIDKSQCINSNGEIVFDVLEDDVDNKRLLSSGFVFPDRKINDYPINGYYQRAGRFFVVPPTINKEDKDMA